MFPRHVGNKVCAFCGCIFNSKVHDFCPGCEENQKGAFKQANLGYSLEERQINIEGRQSKIEDLLREIRLNPKKKGASGEYSGRADQLYLAA